MRHVGLLVAAALAAVPVALLPSAGRACSISRPEPRAVPGIGATDVSPATTITIEWFDYEPESLALTADGEPLPFHLEEVATGLHAVHAELPGSKRIVLTGPERYGDKAERKTLSDFTTSPTYDKKQGTPPTLNAVRIKRIRHPVEQLNSGSCVFAEYEVLLEADLSAAVVPDTPEAEVVYTVVLAPKTSGWVRRFGFFGDRLGKMEDGWTNVGVTGLDLDPAREYCVTVEAYGRGNLARGAMGSEKQCAGVDSYRTVGCSSMPGAALPVLAALGLSLLGRSRRKRDAPIRGPG